VTGPGDPEPQLVRRWTSNDAYDRRDPAGERAVNWRPADALVATLLGIVVLVGTFMTWQAFGRRQADDGSMGSMMDSSMGSSQGPDPLWFLLGTLLLVAVIAVPYVVVREASTASGADRVGADDSNLSADESHGVDEDTTETATPAHRAPPETAPEERVLDLLPDDERRVLSPVIESPGITQIELRDRSDFSKSKVSQTVSELEERGLLYRERQGRTYRVYPSDDLESRRASET